MNVVISEDPGGQSTLTMFHTPVFVIGMDGIIFVQWCLWIQTFGASCTFQNQQIWDNLHSNCDLFKHL